MKSISYVIGVWEGFSYVFYCGGPVMSNHINAVKNAKLYVLGVRCDVGNDIINMRGSFLADGSDFYSVGFNIVEKLFKGGILFDVDMGGAMIVAIVIYIYVWSSS